VVTLPLHKPTVRLKGAEGSYEHLHVLRELFDLEPDLAEKPPVAEVTDLESRRRQRG
jgi:hypothetical protein